MTIGTIVLTFLFLFVVPFIIGYILYCIQIKKRIIKAGRWIIDDGRIYFSNYYIFQKIIKFKLKGSITDLREASMIIKDFDEIKPLMNITINQVKHFHITVDDRGSLKKEIKLRVKGISYHYNDYLITCYAYNRKDFEIKLDIMKEIKDEYVKAIQEVIEYIEKHDY